MFVLCVPAPDDPLEFRLFAGFMTDGTPRYTQIAVRSFTDLQMSVIGMMFFTSEFAASEAARYNALIASENNGISPGLFVMQLHVLQAHLQAWSSKSALIIERKSKAEPE